MCESVCLGEQRERERERDRERQREREIGFKIGLMALERVELVE